MTSPARVRLLKDLKRFENQDGLSNIYAMPKSNKFLVWESLIFGPVDTIWEGGVFKLLWEFNEEYPNKPPAVQFVSHMFHPNVYGDGKICLDILTNQWSPIYDVHTILTSIQSWLSDPNPDSPANAEAARLFLDNLEEYNNRVKECVYASWRIK